VVAGHDPFDDLGRVHGVELVEQVQSGEAPVGAVEPDVLHHQRLERVLLQGEVVGTGEEFSTQLAGRVTCSTVTM
jgi:hypothetical protein